jgi:hypothetical protein
MNIERVTISISSLEPLHQYQNVKPEISLTAVVGEGERPEDVIATLTVSARDQLNRLIDEYRTRNGLPLRYYIGRTYAARVWRFHSIEFVLIVPNSYRPAGNGLPGMFDTYHDNSENEFSGQKLDTLRAWLIQSWTGDIYETDHPEIWAFDYLLKTGISIIVAKRMAINPWDTVAEYAVIPSDLWANVRNEFRPEFAGNPDEINAWLAGKKVASAPNFVTEIALREWSDNIDRLSKLSREKKQVEPVVEEDDEDEDDNG